ncbi:AAA family ATPase [Antarcticirhabdus aurantiaca]|uniref:AAA family ATPase n=1 Tax=Antarcticirhabdus aurantiaca TaxID=2606717 RepID=A0ACD4NJN8_9HYPH|nr:AAA family ATPase [Antarcticirhabdus aurantiaca]WAJ27044.1 AAA family ATPase [Jeongeuplla avenae]
MSAALEMPAPDYAALLHAIFAGNERYHATAAMRDSYEPGEKVVPAYAARREPVTLSAWQRHLDGGDGLVVAPIRDDDTCIFGCLDVDSYDVNHADLVAKIEHQKLPLVVCKSKSGGAHIYLFASEPVSARNMRAVLDNMRATLGLPSATEVFPKQEILSEGTDNPSVLNMPYHGGDHTSRYGVRSGGMPMDLEQFVAAVEKSRVSAAQVAALAAARPASSPASSRQAPAERADVDARDVADRLVRWAATIAAAPVRGANNVLASVLFAAGRWTRDTDLTEAAVRAALLPAWVERHRRSQDPEGDRQAERVFDDIFRRQIAKGRAKGRPVEKGEADVPVVTSLSDVTPQPIEWLWPGRFAMGKVSMLAGQPGLGKSNLALWIGAQVTRGGRWPEGEGTAPEGDVILLSAEDDPTDTIRPRWDAAGGDPARARVVEAVRTGKGQRGFDLGRDVAMLGDILAQQPDTRLVIIDPVSAYLGSIDSHRNTDVRGILAPVQKLAEEHRVAVLLVSHLRKAGGEAINAIQGSGAFVAAVRTACIVTKEVEVTEGEDGHKQKEETGRRILSVAKNNLGPDGDEQSLAYRIVVRDNGDGITAPAVSWDGRVKISADEALNPSVREERRGKKIDEARALLRRLLKEGAMPAIEVKTRAGELGIGERTLEAAKADVGVIAKKEQGRGGRWMWHLPGVEQELPI